jgi:4,5-DOPA dioxygenase extradiol
MPALFIGHGSPMNALEDNAYTRAWRELAQALPRPRAVLVISAHWMTQALAVTANAKPPTIHDFGGFPPALFAVQYPAPGEPDLAARVQGLLAPEPVRLDSDWGLDHGSWSVLLRMYPEADIPVVQLSLDLSRPAQDHFEFGRALRPLRDEGVLILGSGNVVHNLRVMRWGPQVGAYPWAVRFDERVRRGLEARDYQSLVGYRELGEDARLSIPTPEHYLPLLYCMGIIEPDDALSFPVEGIAGGSISMLSVQIGGGGSAHAL